MPSQRLKHQSDCRTKGDRLEIANAVGIFGPFLPKPMAYSHHNRYNLRIFCGDCTILSPQKSMRIGLEIQKIDFSSPYAPSPATNYQFQGNLILVITNFEATRSWNTFAIANFCNMIPYSSYVHHKREIQNVTYGMSLTDRHQVQKDENCRIPVKASKPPMCHYFAQPKESDTVKDHKLP